MTLEINYRPHAHQRAIHLAWETPRRVVVATRQGGKTVAGAHEIGEWGMSAPARWPQDTQHQFWWLTRTYKTKPKAWRELTTNVPPQIISSKSDQKSEIILKNGAQISVRSADGKDSLVSERLHGVVLDEFTLYPPEVWYQLVNPMLATTGGPALFLGSARGKNWGYEIFQNQLKGVPGWKSFSWDIYQVPYVSPTWIADTKRDTPERIWQQEYLAQFLTDGGEVFRNVDGAVAPAAQPDDYTIISVDVARTHDWTAIFAFNSKGEWVASRRVGHLDWSVQRVAIIELYKRVNAKKAVIDISGLQLDGEAIAYDLRREGLLVEPFRITGETKRYLIENLMWRFDMGAITIPMEAAEEFHAFEVISSEKTGNDKYSAPEGKHDDWVMSAALGMHGLRQFQIRESDTPRKSEGDLMWEHELEAVDPNAWVGKEWED